MSKTVEVTVQFEIEDIDDHVHVHEIVEAVEEHFNLGVMDGENPLFLFEMENNITTQCISELNIKTKQ